MVKEKKTRVAAVGDLHCTRDSKEVFAPLFSRISKEAHVLALCGDLTDFGYPEEAELLAAELKKGLSIPCVAVLGNHDCEQGKMDEIKEALQKGGVIVLDGSVALVCGIGFAGVKGFMGGFGRGALGAWGEASIKELVREAHQEAHKLDRALSSLATASRIVLLHYSPIRGTLEGEPLEIFPYLGSSHLGDVLIHHPVSAVFHGHAHQGVPEARTATGVPVYNVAMPLLRRVFPGHPPYRMVEFTNEFTAQITS